VCRVRSSVRCPSPALGYGLMCNIYTFAVSYSSVMLYIGRRTYAYAMYAESVTLLCARVLYCVIVLCVIYIHLQWCIVAQRWI